MTQKYLWLAVTADKYELPIAVADSAKELAAMCGVSTSTIISSAKRNNSGTLSGKRYRRTLRYIGDDNEQSNDKG